jgi:nucleoside-diphosphate-sugar epimerase
MSKEELSKIRLQTPVSLILRGANKIGFELSKVLIEQGSKVIIVDEYNVTSKKYITDLKKLGDCDFIDFKGYEQLFKTINRIDYIFYLQYEFLLENREYSSKEFLEESNHLNIALKAAVQFNSKFALISTISQNKNLALQINNPSYVNPSPYSAIELQKYSETLTAEYHDKSKANVRILRLGTILGNELDIYDDPVLQQLLQNSVNDTKLVIYGEGLDTHYLINIEDALYGILKLTFSDKTTGEVISLSNNNEYTTLSIAYKLLELNTSALEIKFEHEPGKKPLLYNQYIAAPNAEKFGWKQSIHFEQTMMMILENSFKRLNKKWTKPEKSTVSQKAKELVDTVSHVRIERTALGETLFKLSTPFRAIQLFFSKIFGNLFNGNKAISLKSLIIPTIILSLLFYFILGPLLSIGISGYLTYTESKKAIANVKALNFSTAKENLTKIDIYAKSINNNLGKIKWMFDLTGKQTLFSNTQDLAIGGKLTIDGALNSIDALTPLGNYLKDFEPAIDFESGTPKTTREYKTYLEEIQKQKAQLVNSSNDALLGLQYIKKVDTEIFPTFIRQNVVDIKNGSEEIGQLIEPAQKIVTFLPDLLGIDGRKRYLIILQNPSELRSTGGWLSSYGLIGIEAGQIRELTIDDVYNAEGTLKNLDKFYSAPEDMQKALEIKNWSLSLSNWSPDFTDASNNAEFFVKEAAIAPSLDGVISIDVTLIQDLLKVWGGLEVAGEKEIITADNLYPKIFEIHDEFTPGSTQKSTFLSNLSSSIIKKLLSSKVEDIKPISNTLFAALDKKDILIYMKNQTSNQYFTNEGWSGAITKSYLSAPTVVQWNWGGNKANLFLKQNANLKVNIINVNEIQYSYELDIKNNSVTNTYPEGDYKNYLRIQLPEDAEITSLNGFVDNYYSEKVVNNRRTLSGWFNVPKESEQKFILKYTLRRNDKSNLIYPIASKANNLIFDIDFFKQPGLMNSDYKLEVTYPDSWRATSYDNMQKVSNFVTASGTFDTDKKFQVKWELK